MEKFIGDAVVAVFGAPVAHEDDPERAVRAALAIRDWVLEEQELQVRIAVHTGEALVALGARPAEGEGMVAGDVVNVSFDSRCNDPTVIAKLDTNPLAALYSAPVVRQKAVVSNPDTLKKLII